MVTLLTLAGFFVFLACLAAFHSFLVATNQTTHELARCARCLPLGLGAGAGAGAAAAASVVGSPALYRCLS